MKLMRFYFYGNFPSVNLRSENGRRGFQGFIASVTGRYGSLLSPLQFFYR